MPIFKVHIDRPVVSYDRFTRFVKADDLGLAQEIAQELAESANRDCPDDAGPSGHDPDLEGWEVNEVVQADDEDLAFAEPNQMHESVTEEEDEDE